MWGRLHTRTWVGFLVLGIGVLGIILYLLPGQVPWVPGGTIVLAVKAVPVDSKESTSFGIGLDDIILHTEKGDTVSTHLLPQRILLETDKGTLTPLLSVRVPNGSYRGISLRVRSPEIRNDWQGDTPPQAVALLYEEILIPIPFTVTEDQTTAIIMGLETLQAIHPDGDREVYLPVMQVETRANARTIESPGIPYAIQGGTIVGSATYGMRWDGTVAQNVRAPHERPATEEGPQNEFASEHSEQQSLVESPTDTAKQTDATSTEEVSTSTEEIGTSTEAVASSTEEAINGTDTGVTF